MLTSSERKKVMIVDDSEIVLAVAQYALQAAGYEVVTHPRPAGCIALILQEQPDLLLIDVNMPGLNGDTVVKMLGSTRANTDMVVLLHSSLSDEVLAEKATSSRAHGYIRKSDSPQDMVRQVARWVKPSGLQKLTSGSFEVAGRSSEPKIAVSGKYPAADRIAAKILLAHHDIVQLSELRRLLGSQLGSVEFALSGKEVLRRLQMDQPPDVVVLGSLNGSPDTHEVAISATRLNAKWNAKIIILSEGGFSSSEGAEVRIGGRTFTRLLRPFTEVDLCGAIQNCLQMAS